MSTRLECTRPQELSKSRRWTHDIVAPSHFYSGEACEAVVVDKSRRAAVATNEAPIWRQLCSGAITEVHTHVAMQKSCLNLGNYYDGVYYIDVWIH